MRIMPPVLKQVLISSNGRFINDKILKLYWRDRNAEILEKFNYALNKILKIFFNIYYIYLFFFCLGRQN